MEMTEEHREASRTSSKNKHVFQANNSDGDIPFFPPSVSYTFDENGNIAVSLMK